MEVYSFTLLSTYVFTLLSRLMVKRNMLISNVFYILSFLVLWLVSALRYRVGTDFYNYYIYFNRIHIAEVRNNEYGIWIVGSIIKFFTSNGQFFIGACSLITIVLIYMTINKNSLLPELSIILFISFGFYFTSFNIIRQYIALSIVFYAVQLLFQNKGVYFILLIFLASFFHYSAILCLAIFIIYKLQQNNITLRNLVVVGTVFCYFLYDIIIKNIFLGDYQIYNNTKYLNEGASITFFIVNLIIITILLFMYNKLIIYNPNNQLYIILILIGTGISLLGTKSLIINRVSEYFSIYTILVLPDVVGILKDKHLKIMGYVGLIIFSILGFYLYLSRNLGGVLPYHMIFN